MYAGYDIKAETHVQKPEYQYENKPTEFQKGHHPHSEHKHTFNPKAPSFEAGQMDSFQIPHHLRMLFTDNENKPLFDAKSHLAPTNNVNTNTNFPSHSTLDSRRLSEYEQPEGMRYSSFNTLLNQSNEFGGLKNAPNDLNTSSFSDRDKDVSLNNLSRNSGYKMDLNTSNSRRNQSSRSNNLRAKNYQVTINEDIKLIERIETVLNAIIANHNKVCPFCNKLIDVKKSNFQNVSSFYSNSMKRYYLTHFDCYLKSGASHAPSKVLSLVGVTKAIINSQLSMLPAFDSTSFLRSDRRAYFLSIEGFHPLNTQTLFKIEKIAYALEHVANKNQLLFLNLENKSSCIFEPSSYMLPFNEFRLAITVHLTHSNEDPFVYEFLVDLSQIKVTSDQKAKYAEAYFPPEGNGVTLGTQIVYDANTELSQSANYKVNLDSSFQSTASTSGKPDFGKNVFMVLKQLSISLPLKRLDKRNQANQDVMVPILPESLFNTSQDSFTSTRKKSHSKLHLNPNAPLFSAHVPNQVEQNPQALLKQQQQGSNQGMGGSSYPQDQNVNAYNPQQNFQNYGNKPPGFNMGNPASNQGNTFFNAPLFAQTFQAEAGSNNPYNIPMQYNNFQGQKPINMHQHQQQQQNEHIALPPGLISMRGNNEEEQHYSAPFIQQNTQPNPPARNKKLHVDTKFQGYVHHNVIEEANEEYQASGQNTPSLIQINEGDVPALDRQKSKGLNNLYAAVLSGRKNDGSMPNSPCPSVTKLKNQYFSGFSTPGSERAQTPTTPKVNALGEQFEMEESGNVPMTEDMFENFHLDDHLGRLVEFAKTYNGSRLLQKFFPRANQHEVEEVIDEIQDHVEELMMDPYANYMFQTLAQSCSADQRLNLLQEIAPSMPRIAADRKGTHSLQAIISLVSRDVEEKLIRDALHDHIVELAFDSQGTHLVQKLIVAISPQNLGFIYGPLIDRFLDVVNHSFGLCVLKVLMTKVEKIPEMKREIIELLSNNFTNLIQNPYGNYALQHAMDVWPHDCGFLLERAADKIVQYSNQKFSSNVIEKCIIIAPLDIRKKYTSEIVKSDRVSELMKNKYGNYVLLKLLSTLDNEGKQLLIQNISKHLNHVNVAKYRSRWTQFIDDNPLKIPGLNPSQTMKPSLFKSASLAENSPSQGRDLYEAGSPSSAELWKDAQKKRPRSEKEEKSQFYYESGKIGAHGSRNLSGHMSGEEMESYQSPEITGSRNLGGQNVGSGNKKGKNANQKFFSDKGQHHMNKGGHTFY